MPSIPDIPGKNLIEETTKRAGSLALRAGTGAVSVGGGLVKRVLSHGGDEDDCGEAVARGGAAAGANGAVAEAPLTDAPSPVRPAGPKVKAAPEPKAAPRPPKPKAAPKPKPDAEAKPKPAPQADRPKPAKPKPGTAAEQPKAPNAKPKAAAKPKAKPKAPKPPVQTGTDAPPKPEAEPGNISQDREHPHRALSNPVGDPDETEYPDPFEKREDPRDPVDPDGAPFGEAPHVPTNAESTSEPPLESDPEVPDAGRPPRREKLDD